MEILNLKLLHKNKVLSIQVIYFSIQDTDLNAIILIKSHMVWNNTVGIIDFERLFDYEKKIGNP